MALLRDAISLDGRTVVFLAPPGGEYVQLILGIMRAGGTAVPLSPLHTVPELAYVIANAEPAIIVATAELLPRLAEAAGGREVIASEPLTAEAAANVKEVLPLTAPEAPAIMLYTSGTTGRPKGVVLSHKAVLATLSALAQAWGWRQDDRLLHVLPLHHTHGVIVALLGALHAGARVEFLAFDPAAAWERLNDATVFMAVPTMYAKLMEAFRAAPADQRRRWSAGASRLRLCTSGSAALPASLLMEFQQATGQVILERYGMTEIGMALSNPYHAGTDAGPRVAGAVGRPLPGVTVDIVTDDERPAAVDEPGELRVTTPQMFLGYHGDPAATAASFDDAGRFRTGDTGVRDGAGVIRLLGRTSVDILKSAGYKISALEIEAVLREHPGVAEVAVIGVPDPTWGECVTACVVGRAGQAPTLESLKEFARGHLAPYKLPRALRLCDSLPRNPMGKVQKKELLAAMSATADSAAPPAKASSR
jgi:malonyl-CoA/methylmalonyl-CoA synthetase